MTVLDRLPTGVPSGETSGSRATRILAIARREHDTKGLERELGLDGQSGLQLRVTTPEQEPNCVDVDVCVVDDRCGEAEVTRVLHRMALRGVPCLLLSSEGGEVLAAKAMSAGAAETIARSDLTPALVAHCAAHALERQRLRDESSSWRERHRRLSERTTVGYYRIGTEGVVLDCNQYLARLLGYTSKRALIGEPLIEYSQRASAPGGFDALAPLRRRSPTSSLHRDVCLRGRNGKRVWVRMSDTPSDVEGDRSEATFEGTAHDLTHERDLSDQLRKSEARYFGLFEVASESMLVIGEDGRLRTLNRRAERLLGADVSQLIGQDVEEIFADAIDEDGRTLTRDELPVARAFESGSAVPAQVIGFKTLAGSRLWVSIQCAQVPIPGESEPAVVAALSDLSPIRKLEGQLVQARNLGVIGRMASGVAHDFRNLMTAVHGFTELLNRAPELTDRSQQLTTEVLQITRRASDLASQILHFAQRRESKVEDVDVDALLDGLDQLMRCFLSGGSELTVETASRGTLVRANAGQLEQVVLNLIINARDAMPEGGDIEVRSSMHEITDESAREEGLDLAPGRYARVEVSDSGFGMSEEVLQRVFEPFFSTKKPTEGTGLGLATSRELVRGFGGEMTIASRPGSGTAVRIDLPAIPGS